jgi:hypothetical protein
MAVRPRSSYSACIDDAVAGTDKDTNMTKHAETTFFLLATVAALALPALPFVQEALTADYTMVEAALPTILMERVEILAAPAMPSPVQVAATH